jgi:hypothetical protein
MPPTGITGEGVAWTRLTAVGVVTGVAAGREVSSGVGGVMAVGVEVEVGDGVAEKGVWVAGVGGPKGEQPSPMMATTPKVQAVTQNLLGIEGRIDEPLSTDKRSIGNNQNVTGDNPSVSRISS